MMYSGLVALADAGKVNSIALSFVNVKVHASGENNYKNNVEFDHIMDEDNELIMAEYPEEPFHIDNEDVEEYMI